MANGNWTDKITAPNVHNSRLPQELKTAARACLPREGVSWELPASGVINSALIIQHAAACQPLHTGSPFLSPGATKFQQEYMPSGESSG